jgi:hypothetical protein
MFPDLSIFFRILSLTYLGLGDLLLHPKMVAVSEKSQFIYRFSSYSRRLSIPSDERDLLGGWERLIGPKTPLFPQRSGRVPRYANRAS